jgi:hypothetical protein
MRRFLLLFALVCTMLLGANAAVARDYGQTECLSAAQAVHQGHMPGDSDEVPADTDRAYPHHHAGWHDHPTCDARESVSSSLVIRSNTIFALASAAPIRPWSMNPALRPPIA